MAKPAPDPNWDRASRVIRVAAKLAGWKVAYYGKNQQGRRWWMMLSPPPATVHRGVHGMTMGYRRGDDFMRRGPYYSLLTRYDQQERVPLP